MIFNTCWMDIFLVISVQVFSWKETSTFNMLQIFTFILQKQSANIHLFAKKQNYYIFTNVSLLLVFLIFVSGTSVTGETSGSSRRGIALFAMFRYFCCWFDNRFCWGFLYSSYIYYISFLYWRYNCSIFNKVAKCLLILKLEISIGMAFFSGKNGVPLRRRILKTNILWN